MAFLIRPIRLREGFTLIEVLVCLVILLVALVPIISLFTSIQRISHSSQRLVETSLHAQMIIEAVAQLEPLDLPVVALDTEVTILSDVGGVAGFQYGTNSGQQMAALESYFRKKPPVPMERTVTIRRLPTGEVLLRIGVEWMGVAEDARTTQNLTLHMLTTPRHWN